MCTTLNNDNNTRTSATTTKVAATVRRRWTGEIDFDIVDQVYNKGTSTTTVTTMKTENGNSGYSSGGSGVGGIEGEGGDMGGAVGNDLKWASVELLASRKVEARRKAMVAKVESWMDNLSQKIAAKAANISTSPRTRRRLIKRSNYSWNVEIRFNDVRVRGKMMKLMNTDLVRLMDREFMKTLQERISQQYEEDLLARLDDRERSENLRESMLVMRGILPKEKGPPGVTKMMIGWEDEPVEKKKAKEKVEEKKEDDEEEENLNASMLDDEAFRPPSISSDLSPIHTDLPDDDLEKVRKETTIKIQEEIDKLHIQPELYEKEHYETETVKTLRQTKGVDNLYIAAEKIFLEI